MHKQEMEAMRADMEKMKSSLALMKANDPVVRVNAWLRQLSFQPWNSRRWE